MTTPYPTAAAVTRELTKWQRRWQWITDFPTTNGIIIFWMIVVTAIFTVTLWMMASGRQAQINETVLGLLLGAALGGGTVGSVQKIKKWGAMPDSGIEEPPPVQNGQST